ncbi:hypothetical protein GMST_25280 [Geomonas silvestris]|uniref:Response regulatory domain-containing protein n=1 Tax=Geomonas silvestris TaxID=2740184 RepID=A0A6V8MKD8_9BACT|nr:response regulator [Geomonas silvestris]GFO60203.1 hypothetical protein GMST_25280 [Geomonas silvestris]
MSRQQHSLHQQAAAEAGLRVLFVDDTEINRELGATVLKRLGHQVTIAADGAEAIAALSCATAFDAVFMDLQMPLLDGLEATRRIRQMAGLDKILIVAMAGSLQPGERDKIRAAGMDDWVSKPIRREELQAVLERRLGSPTVPAAPVPAEEPLPPVFDRQGLLDRLGRDAGQLRRFLEMFFRSAAASLAGLEAALIAGDRDSLRLYAHTLKGTSLNIGAQRLASLSRNLEESAAAGQPEQLRVQFAALRESYREFAQLHGSFPDQSSVVAERREATRSSAPAASGEQVPVGRTARL